MKNYLIPLVAVSMSFAAFSAPDELVVTEMAKQTKLSPSEIRQHYKSCDSGVTLSMKICASYQFHVQDMRLNKIYKLASIQAKNAGHDKSLLKAQCAWIAYRDAECAFEGEMGAGGGSAEGLYVLSCKEELTKHQADRLEAAIR